jgi:hypothetical protein
MIADIEDVQVTAGSFGQCLRVEGGTHWMFDDGRQARSETIYHYAPHIGVVKGFTTWFDWLINSKQKSVVNQDFPGIQRSMGDAL